MEKQDLKITYRGPALDNHEMDVDELFPSISALSTLLKETNTYLSQGVTRTSLKVKGFEANCFTIELSLNNEMLSHLFDSVSNHYPLVHSLLFLGFADNHLGLIQLLIKLQNIPFLAEKTPEGIRIKTDQFEITIGEMLWGLFKNIRVRKSLEDFSAPLRTNEDIELLEVHSNKKKIIIDKHEAKYLKFPPSDEEVIDDNEYEVILETKQIIWGKKWRFSDGDKSFWAFIEDKGFIERIKNGLEKFSEGDFFKVKLRCIQFITAEGLKSEYAITKVIWHKHKNHGTQLRLETDQENL